MSVSRLGLYVPGRIWQMAAMAKMARDERRAAGRGGRLLRAQHDRQPRHGLPRGARRRMALIREDIAGKNRAWRDAARRRSHRRPALCRRALPLLLGWARRATGKDLIDVTIPHRAVYLAIVANIVAWLLYGAAFELFVLGVTGSGAGFVRGLRHHLGLVVPGRLSCRHRSGRARCSRGGAGPVAQYVELGVAADGRRHRRQFASLAVGAGGRSWCLCS